MAVVVVMMVVVVLAVVFVMTVVVVAVVAVVVGMMVVVVVAVVVVMMVVVAVVCGYEYDGGCGYSGSGYDGAGVWVFFLFIPYVNRGLASPVIKIDKKITIKTQRTSDIVCINAIHCLICSLDTVSEDLMRGNEVLQLLLGF